MKTLDVLAAVLLVVGGLNWGLVGLFGFDLVAAIFGPMTVLSRTVYALVGLMALYQMATWKRIQRRWSGGPLEMRSAGAHMAAFTVSALLVTAGSALADCGSDHASSAAATAQAEAPGSEAPMDIVDTAVAAGSFNTLVAAVKAAGLVETLRGEGPLTVFAPTDEAFAKLPKGTLENLLEPANKAKLVDILTYHVVPGRVMAADVVKLKSAKTVLGQEVRISVTDSKVKVDDAQVLQTDIATSNGVIHVIDRVILPKSK